MNDPMVDDLIQHATNRIGTVLSDISDLLPDQDAVLKLYAMTYCFALASLNKGLSETRPIYGSLTGSQRIGVLAVAGRNALDIKDDPDLKSKADLIQFLSDTTAAMAEIKPLFHYKVVFEEDST